MSDDPRAARPDPSPPAGGPGAVEQDPDVQRMRRAAAGDRGAFEALYDRYSRPVMSFVYHLTFDRALAEDLTQETFLRAWRGASGYRPVGRFSTWLFQIAKNVAFTEGGRARRRRATFRALDASEAGASGSGRGAAAPAAASGESGESDARRAELSLAIREALGRLSERLRIVFTLVRLEGRSYGETAEILEIPEGTVKSRMAAAEAALRERLGRFL